MSARIRSFALLVVALIGTSHAQTTAPAAPTTSPVAVKIGVVAYRGVEDAQRGWQPTAEYLTQQLPQYQFQVIPTEFAAMDDAVGRGAFDFVVTNPANYVELEARFGATRIATLRALHQGVVSTQFGGVIFTLANRSDVQTLSDLRRKSFIATDVKSFGGWLMAWRELHDLGIEPAEDFASLRFAGTPDAVVQAVRDGKADAGSVRTAILEELAAEGKIDLASIRVLNEQPKSADFPFERSTRLYPQWAMARLKTTSDELARQVEIALLEMPAQSPAAVAAQSAGWTVPLDYTPVHECLRELRVGPYAEYGKVSFSSAAKQLRFWLMVGAALLLLLTVTTLYLLRLNRTLRHQQMQPDEQHLVANYRRFSRIAAKFLILVGLLVLIGWTFDIELLKRIVPGLVAMNPMTAVAFILCGAALLSRLASERFAAAAYVSASAVLLIGILKLASYLGGADLGIDQVLFRTSVSGLSGEAPNWMAPNTALCFVFSGAALLTLEHETRRGRRPAQILALGLGVMSLLALIGYLYGTHAFYGVTSFIPMALHTAASFMLLALALLTAHPDRGLMASVTSEGAGGMLARRVLPACVLVPILLGWLRLIGEKWGIYGTELGVALHAVGNVIFFVVVVWWNAGLLYRFDVERRHMVQALRGSEERHRAIIQQASEGIYLVDAQSHVVVEANEAIARLLGYKLDEVRSKPIYDLVRDTREGVDARIRRVLDAGAPLVGERQYWRKDGTMVDVGVSATVINYGGRNVICTVVHDITERKRAQKLLEEKNTQLQEAVESERQAHQKLKDAQSQLVQAEKLAGLGQMVAGVAHEINNPLSFVANNVAVLQRDLKAMKQLLELYRQHDAFFAEQRPQSFAEVQELVERIDLNYTLGNLDEMLARCREGLRRIQQIVKDLRDFARLDESDQHESDINAGIQSTANIILGRAKKKQVQIDLQLGNLPMVVCFPAKVNQVVMNLLSNAIDASPEGSSVVISSRAVNGEVQIQVADKGKGIDPSIRHRIFDPFFTTKPLGEGTGLGLSISYGIINDHGGRIDVDSSPGAGSTFTIHLPVKPTPANPKPSN